MIIYKNNLLSTLILSMIACSAYAEESKPYRPAHNETCVEIPGHKIPCGNFKIASTLLAKKYDTVSAGADVLASFSVETHPGDHPFLRRLAKKLGYIDSDPEALTNQSVLTWKELSPKIKKAIADKYSDIETTPEAKALLPNYINSCINYWAAPNATHDKRTELPTIAEVSALCIADSGVLAQ